MHFTQNSSNKQTNTVSTQKSPNWACGKACAEACAERFSALNVRGARDFQDPSAVSGFRFPSSQKSEKRNVFFSRLRPSAKHRKVLPHSRNTSGTWGRDFPEQKVTFVRHVFPLNNGERKTKCTYNGINSFALGTQRNWCTFFYRHLHAIFLLSPLAVVFFGAFTVFSAARQVRDQKTSA